jgi:hypothetical protein
MHGIGLLLAAWMQAAPAAVGPSIAFYFTNEEVLQQGLSAASAQWAAQCLAGGEFADVAKAYAPDPRMGADERRAQSAKFDRSEFVRLATDAWRKANAALPQGPLRVCVDLAAPADAFTRDRMGGVSAVTAGRGRITLRIHPDADWRSAVPYAIAHEMHHSYWAQYHYDPARPFTLADYLVLEGRADYFASRLFTFRAPWIAALDATAYAAAWRAISKELSSTEWGTLQAMMFGAPQAGIPAWAGYTIGHRLVAERMGRGPNLDLKAMTAAPASEFVRPAASQ